MWNVIGETTDFLISESNEEVTITINTKLERNLTKEERKSIKGKVSKASYKSSKYHQMGTIKYSLKIQWIYSTLRVVEGVGVGRLNIVR